MKEIIGTLQTNYTGRLAKMYILNVSFGIMLVWKMISTIINEGTKSKIKVFSTANPKEHLEDIHPSQVPIKYGGEYDMPANAWPPTFPPQIYRDEYDAMHFTIEEFKEELLKNKLAVPSPEMAEEMKGLIKGKRVPEKLYYLVNNQNQFRSTTNEIIKTEVFNKTNKIESVSVDNNNYNPRITKTVQPNKLENSKVEEIRTNFDASEPMIEVPLVEQHLPNMPNAKPVGLINLKQNDEKFNNNENEVVIKFRKESEEQPNINYEHKDELKEEGKINNNEIEKNNIKEEVDLNNEESRTYLSPAIKDFHNKSDILGANSASTLKQQEIKSKTLDKTNDEKIAKNNRKTKTWCCNCIII